MNQNDLTKAENLLSTGAYTCVLCRGNELYTSEARGVKPLVAFVENGTDLVGFCAADKVVGKATAFLYAKLGVSAVHAAVISATALEVLQKSSISVTYDTLVPHIINRQGDGICPFEQAVWNIGDKDAAYTAILEKMAAMNITL